MNFEGSVYHPKLVSFDASVGIAPQQSKSKSEQSTNDESFHNDILSRYRVNAQILKEKPVQLSFYANKEDNEVNRDFFERQSSDSLSYGAQIGYKNQDLPLEFTYNYSESTTDRSLRLDLSAEEEKIGFRTAPEVGPIGTVHFNYTHSAFERMEEGLSNQTGDTDEMALSNRWQFSKDNSSSLMTSMHYNDLRGSNSHQDFSADELLTWAHTDRLDTLYRYRYNKRSSGTVNLEDNGASIGVRHRLYESLTSSARIEGSKTDSTTFEERSLGAFLNESYRKDVGPADVNLDVDLSFNHEQRDSMGTFLKIVDEQHALLDTSIVLLNEVGAVDLSTVIITNAGGTIIYTENVDYTLTARSSGQVEIKRIVTGSIADGEEILADYIVERAPNFNYNEIQSGYRIGFDFYEDRLRTYYSMRQKKHSDINGSEDIILEDVDNTLTGAELDLGWMTLRAEYEDYESNLSSYDAIRLGGVFRWTLTRKTDLIVNANHNQINLEEATRTTDDVRGNLTVRLGPGSVYKLEIGQYWQEGGGSDGERFTARNLFRRTMGKMYAELGYEFEQETFTNDTSENHYIYGSIKREF